MDPWTDNSKQTKVVKMFPTLVTIAVLVAAALFFFFMR